MAINFPKKTLRRAKGKPARKGVRKSQATRVKNVAKPKMARAALAEAKGRGAFNIKPRSRAEAISRGKNGRSLTQAQARAKKKRLQKKTKGKAGFGAISEREFTKLKRLIGKG